MPTYEYACDNCGHRFDVRQSFSDDPIRECPECTGAVRRVLYPSGVIFKGSGWYITDSRSSGLGSNGSSASSDSSSADTSPKSESPTSSTESAEKSGKSETKTPAKTKAAAATDD
ncbi:MAG: hypothetical protein M3173_07010 [Chloroflexota bacterium]|nr:hypothetical protein [Chloroflexota bacterium]